MKKYNFKFLTLGLLLLLAQNSIAAWQPYMLEFESKDRSVRGEVINVEGLRTIAIAPFANGDDETWVYGNHSIAFGIANKIGRYQNGAEHATGVAKSSTAIGSYNIIENDADFSSIYGISNNVSTRGNFIVGSVNSSVKGVGFNYVFGAANNINGEKNYIFGDYNDTKFESKNNFIMGSKIKIYENIEKAVVLGYESATAGSNTVSVGSSTNKRRIAFVADAVNDSDAVNKRQMNNAIAAALSTSSIDLSPYTKRDASNLTTSDITAWKTKLGVVAIDAYTKTESDNKFLDKVSYIADKATFATKTELGTKVNRDASNLTASDIVAWKAKLAVTSVSGIVNTATGADSTGLGHGNVVTGTKSTAVGYKNEVSGNNSGAFGDPNIVTGNRSYAFGNDNKIAGNDNFVMGSNVVIGAGITNSVALGNNSTVSGSNEVSVGSATNKRKITNVADGELSATSSDAVTGRQLYNAMQNSSSLGIENLRNEVNTKLTDMKSEINHVGSLSAALSALHPMQYDPQAPNQIMAGFGHYRDKQAVAVGVSHYFSDNFLMTAGLAIGSERRVKTMMNVGLTWKLGKGGSSSATNTPSYIVQDEMNRLARENNQLKSLVNTQNDRLQKQDERINAQAQEIELMKQQLNILLKKK